jgi:hypothetical protein
MQRTMVLQEQRRLGSPALQPSAHKQAVVGSWLSWLDPEQTERPEEEFALQQLEVQLEPRKDAEKQAVDLADKFLQELHGDNRPSTEAAALHAKVYQQHSAGMVLMGFAEHALHAAALRVGHYSQTQHTRLCLVYRLRAGPCPEHACFGSVYPARAFLEA